MISRAWERVSLFVDVADEIHGQKLAAGLAPLGFTPPESSSRRLLPPIIVHSPWVLIHPGEGVELRAYPFGVLEVSLLRDLGTDISGLHQTWLSGVPGTVLKPLREIFARVMEAGQEALQGQGSGEEELYRFGVIVPDPPVPVSRLWEQFPLVSWLMGEDEDFSPEIHASIRRAAFSYTTFDLLLVGWDRTLLLDPWEETQVLDIVAYALAQDLELATFDRYLDGQMDRAHEFLRGRRRVSGRDLRELREWALDFLESLDRVRAGIKLTDDPYYARVYDRALQVFGVPPLQESLETRLRYLERLLEFLENEQRDRRLELVEWGIFLLILLEILLWLPEIFRQFSR